jgi:hypothetical protein
MADTQADQHNGGDEEFIDEEYEDEIPVDASAGAGDVVSDEFCWTITSSHIDPHCRYCPACALKLRTAGPLDHEAEATANGERSHRHEGRHGPLVCTDGRRGRLRTCILFVAST